tara:strand:+ start:135221 stop:137869 length:2649 start_codon:yes stop_codon:yes gene_type:complete
MAKKGVPFTARDPEGKVYQGTGLQGFCQSVGVNYTSAYKNLNGKTQSCGGGWVFERVNPDITDTTDWKHYSATNSATQTAKQGSKLDTIDLNLDGDIDYLMSHGPEIAEAILDMENVDPKRCVRNLITLLMRVSLGVADGKEPPAGWSANTLLNVGKEMAKAHGIDWDKAADTRTPQEISADAMVELIRMGPTELLCQTDDMLDAMEAQLDEIDALGSMIYDKLNDVSAGKILGSVDMPEDQNPDEPPGPKAIRAVAHQWQRRIRRVRELARRAKEPCDPESTGKRRRVQEATHLLRYMLYVDRSERPNLSTLADEVYVFGEIHVRAVMGLHFSREGYGRTEYGLLKPGDVYHTSGQARTFKGIHYSGTLIMLPPRHGKTVIVKADMALAINLKPDIQMAIVHDTEDMASKILVSVATRFSKETEQGRRNYRLFPYELDPTDNNNYSIRVKTRNRPMNANLIACGVWSSGLGNNLHRLYGDDIVPASDVHEAAKRTRRIKQFHTVWGSRDQGSCAYSTLTGYPHHYQDLMWKTWEGAVLSAKTNGRQGLNWWCVRIPVGGPKDKPGIKKFQSIFKVYPYQWLKDKYRSYSDRAVWAANYELDPMPEGSKIVEKVELYDSESPETRRMLDLAEHIMSIDPTSTKNLKTSDMVGVSIGALGESVTLTEDEYGNSHSQRRRMLYITHDDEFLATQPEIIDHMLAISDARPLNREINQAIIEVTGVGHSLVDFLESLHGINGVHEAKASANKAERFRAVAGMIENSDPQNAPPKVALPGRRKRDENGDPIIGGELELLPGFERLYNYIVNFKVESGFHSLDAMVHMVEFCKQNRGLAQGGNGFSRQAAARYAPGTSMTKVNYEKNNKPPNRRSRDRRMRSLTHSGV